MDDYIRGHEADFTKVFRGYSTTEVDEYIDDLIAKKTELEKNNSLLSEKLESVTAEFEESKRKIGIAEKVLADAQEESERIKSSAAEEAKRVSDEAKALSDKMQSEAKASASKLQSEAEAFSEKTINETKTKAENIINEALEKQKQINAELEAQITEKQEEYNFICDKVEEFKKALFEQYTDHITKLQNIEISRVEKTYAPEIKEESAEKTFPSPEKVETEEKVAPIASELPKETEKTEISENIEEIVKEVQELKIVREAVASTPKDGKMHDIRQELEAIKAEINSRNK